MDYNSSFYLLLGFLGSFIGTLPFGPINLSVVDTTIKKGTRAALVFSLAAAVIEFVYSLISLICYWEISVQMNSNRMVPAGVALVFILGGIYFFQKKEKVNQNTGVKRRNENFIKGLIISILNPQAVPYWVFVIGFYRLQRYIDMSIRENLELLLIFVSGAALGKIACLGLFTLLSKAIEHHLTKISFLMNKIIGGVLILIGCFQVIKIL